MSAADRIKTMRTLLSHVRDITGISAGFVLWDGSTVPDNLAPDAFAIVLADEGVVSTLLRHRSMEAMLNLWVSGRVDLRNGTLFDLAAQKPKVRTRDLLGSADKLLGLDALRRFWFVGQGPRWPLKDIPDERPSDGSRAENERNIQYHYDVSNAFYALWLDSEMVYTCAYCTDWDNDIERMQADKLEYICRKLRLKPGERMLDIGSGWGALCFHAATRHGVTAHGVTLSTQQYEYARAKAERLGLADRVTFELADYATVQGQFDKISSVGFQEAIGLDNFKTYYDTVRRVLKPGGLFLNHAITRPAKADDKAFRRRNEETALMTKYIFPGGELDHIGNTVTSLERHGFEVHDVENLREHYQRTCRHWHDRLLANYDAAVAEVGSVKTRLWLIFLAGSSIQFERNGMRLYQTLASHKRRGPTGLPPTRADLYR